MVLKNYEEDIKVSDLFSKKNKYRKTEDIIDTSEVPTVVGVLIRVSSDMQLDGDSLEMQEELAIQHIQSIGGVLFKIYKEEAISASKTRIENRVKLQELMQDIEDGKVNYIIAYKRDRLFRNSIEHMQFLQFLVENNCDIHFSARGETQLDLSAYKAAGVAKLMENFLSTMAEMESAQTSARVSDTMISKALRGDIIIGRTPIGYKREGDIYVPVEEFREMKEKIESLYLSGYGIKTIATWLNGRKVKGLDQLEKPYPKPSDYTINDDWNQRNISTVLFSPFYTGHVSLNSKKNLDMDTIIERSPNITPFRTMSQQKKINEFREKKSSLKKAPRAYNTPFILSGIIHCAECGRPLKTQTSQLKNGTRYSYYKCGHKYVETNNNCSMGRQFKKEIIEKMVLEVAKVKLKEFLDDETELIFNEKLNGEVISKENHIEAISGKINTLNNKISQYANMIVEIDDIELKQVYLSEQKKTLVELNELKETHAVLLESVEDKVDEKDKFNSFIEMAKEFSDVIDSVSVGIQKQLLENLFSNILVNKNGDIRLEMKIGNMKIGGKDFKNPLSDKVSDKVPSFISLDTIREYRGVKDIKVHQLGFNLVQLTEFIFNFNYDKAITDLFKSLSQLYIPFLSSINPKFNPENSNLINDDDIIGFDYSKSYRDINYSKWIYYVTKVFELNDSMRTKVFKYKHFPAITFIRNMLTKINKSPQDFIDFVNSNSNITIFKDEYTLLDFELVLKSNGIKNAYLFKDVIVCNECGSNYTVKNLMKIPHYTCCKNRSELENRCKPKSISENDIINKITSLNNIATIDRRFVLENIKKIEAYVDGTFKIIYK